jgi:hypothetical protein
MFHNRHILRHKEDGDCMENELEGIKSVLDMYEENEDKIAFLLRQVELLIQSRDYYKGLTLKEN